MQRDLVSIALPWWRRRFLDAKFNGEFTRTRKFNGEFTRSRKASRPLGRYEMAIASPPAGIGFSQIVTF
jgi:hypothetical protein